MENITAEELRLVLEFYQQLGLKGLYLDPDIKISAQPAQLNQICNPVPHYAPKLDVREK